MKKKKSKWPYRGHHPVFHFFRPIFSLFFQKVEIICLPDYIEDVAIYLGNHSAKSGPMTYELRFPKYYVPWGAHEMLGNYKSRFRYLRDVFYIQKQHMHKFPASLKAGFEAIFSKMIYKGMRLIGTYRDQRMMETIKQSVKILEEGTAIMLFPEDSSEGYKEILTGFFPGFVMLADRYYKKHGIDLPVYPIYYSRKKNKMVIGHPLYVQDFVKQGLNRYQIADEYCKVMNQLYFDYIK